MPYFDQILVCLFPRKKSVQLSIFHSGHFCTAMWITRGHTPIYKNCSKDRAETSYFLSYIVFLHVSSLTVLLKSLSTYINLHCHFSWQLWISTVERFRPTFPHASQQSTKSTKRESKAIINKDSFAAVLHCSKKQPPFSNRTTCYYTCDNLLNSNTSPQQPLQLSDWSTSFDMWHNTMYYFSHTYCKSPCGLDKKTCLPKESRNLLFLNPWHVRSV